MSAEKGSLSANGSWVKVAQEKVIIGGKWLYGGTFINQQTTYSELVPLGQFGIAYMRINLLPTITRGRGTIYTKRTLYNIAWGLDIHIAPQSNRASMNWMSYQQHIAVAVLRDTPATNTANIESTNPWGSQVMLGTDGHFRPSNLVVLPNQDDISRGKGLDRERVNAIGEAGGFFPVKQVELTDENSMVVGENARNFYARPTSLADQVDRLEGTNRTQQMYEAMITSKTIGNGENTLDVMTNSVIKNPGMVKISATGTINLFNGQSSWPIISISSKGSRLALGKSSKASGPTIVEATEAFEIVIYFSEAVTINRWPEYDDVSDMQEGGEQEQVGLGYGSSIWQGSVLTWLYNLMVFGNFTYYRT